VIFVAGFALRVGKVAFGTPVGLVLLDLRPRGCRASESCRSFLIAAEIRFRWLVKFEGVLFSCFCRLASLRLALSFAVLAIIIYFFFLVLRGCHLGSILLAPFTKGL